MRLAFTVLLLLVPDAARADAIGAPPPCKPGFSRDLGGPLGGVGFWGHGGAPRCQPALCDDPATCAVGQRCREDAHCVQTRTERELRPSPGRRPRLDPDDPDSWRDVTRLYDGGRCTEQGACPDGWRCVAVGTCRPQAESDSVGLATEGRPGSVAERAWSRGRPFGTPAPEPPTRPEPHAPSEPATPSDPESTPSVPAPPTASASDDGVSRPAASGPCGCSTPGRSSGSRTRGVAALAPLLLLGRRRLTRSG